MTVSLTWTSRSLIAPYSPEMLEVVRKTLAHNRALGVTGALMFSETSFFQVLEGPQDAVRDTFRRIEHDWRHTHVTKLDEHPVPAPLFRGHDMKFVEARHHHLSGRPVAFDAIVAMNDGQRRDLAQALLRA